MTNKIIYILAVIALLTSCKKESYDNMQRNSFVKFFGSQYVNSAKDVMEHNSDYVFVGYTLTDLSHRKGLIVKTNEFGNTQWESVSFALDRVELNGVTLGNDGSYVVCGELEDSTGQKDLYVAKFSSDGVFQWENSFGGINDQIGKKIVRGNDGGYVIIGNTTRAGGNNNPAGSYDMMAVKIDENGDSVLTNQFGGINQDFGNDIIPYGGNQYFAIGTTQSFDGFFESYHSGKLIYIVMLSNQLGEDDAHCWGNQDNQTGNSVSFDNNGNLLIAGGNLVIAGAIQSGYLISVDPTNIRNQLDSIIVSPTGLEEFYDARMQSDGTICATGTVTISSVNKIGVYKINSNGFSLDTHFDLGYQGASVGNRVIPSSNGGFLIAGSSLYELNSKATLIKLNEKVEL